MECSRNTIKVNGAELEYFRIDNDFYGNPRYLFHFMELEKLLNIEEKDILKRFEIVLQASRKIGRKKYRGKNFKGGIVISSYNLKNSLENFLRKTFKNF